MDVSGDGHLRSDRRDINHVTGRRERVLGHVTEYQQIIQIKVGDGLPIAAKLNVTERALHGGTARGKQGGDQGAERAQGVGPGATGLTYDEHLNRPKLAHFHIEIEAPVNRATAS